MLQLEGSLRISKGQQLKTVAETCSIELIDCESSDAALAAAWLADEPCTALASCIEQRRIDDLNELVVGDSRHMQSRYLRQ